jgi:CRP/FNR family cyclic AMP-dependent transcriptional regulator
MRLSTDRTLDVGSLAAVGSETRIRPYRKKQIIFSQGDRSDSMFYVIDGAVKLAMVSREGKEAIIAILGSGRYFGESCLSLENPVRFHSAIALTDARLLKLGRKAILQMLRSGEDVSVNLILSLLKQNAEIQEDLTNRLVDSAEQSVARVISSFAQFKGTGASAPKISQQNIAEMMGITRQRVNALMRRLGLSQHSR